MQSPTAPIPTSDAPSPSQPQAVDARAWELAQRTIDLARGLIVSKNPYLSAAVGLLVASPASLADAFATDGATLHTDARRVLEDFAQTRTAPAHDLAHVLVHCLLLHPFASPSLDASSWDLACDIAAELLVTEIMGPRPSARGAQTAQVLKRLSTDVTGALTAERLYRLLQEGAYASERRSWAALFHVDDHMLWPPSAGDARPASGTGPSQTGGADGDSASPQANPQSTPTDTNPSRQDGTEGGVERQDGRDETADSAGPATPDHHDGSSSESPEAPSPGATGPDASTNAGLPRLGDAARARAERAWTHAAQSMRVDLQTRSRLRGEGLTNLVRELEVGAHERVDYREFLRQFAVEHEDMRLSDDEFDYVFYTYGLELYGNVPLVEPLEYRNERRIRDFAIVIDTSSSVSAKVVQEFVNTTFDVLSSEASFFSSTNIHIIQADARVQSDAKISSLADLDRWRRTIKLRGFGGTDFRPAFRYVQELRQAGEFDDLQGLVYFTDGWGIYPERMPPYKCAFVFYDEDHRPDLVPPWAIQVVLHPGEFESMSVYH